MLKGECNCGNIKFQVSADVEDVYVCHCSICRRATGANGIAVIVVSNDDFQWTQGQDKVKTWSKPNHDWEISFCPECGSKLPGDNDPERKFIPCGALSEGDAKLKVAHHIFVDSKASWDEIGDSGKQHKRALEG